MGEVASALPAPTPARRIVRARRPQRPAQTPTPTAPTPPASTGRRIVRGQKPSTEDPRRIKARMDYLEALIVNEYEDGFITEDDAKKLFDEIDYINKTQRSFSDKMEALLRVEKDLRKMAKDDAPMPF